MGAQGDSVSSPRRLSVKRPIKFGPRSGVELLSERHEGTKRCMLFVKSDHGYSLTRREYISLIEGTSCVRRS